MSTIMAIRMSIATMPTDYPLERVAQLLQLADSALPVGGFAFSNALESAVAYGVVGDVSSLEEFTYIAMRQASMLDCVAARVTWEAAREQRFEEILNCDKALMDRKLNAEQRTMSLRMGRKMAELARGFISDDIFLRWMESISSGVASGMHAITQGVIFAACDVPCKVMFGAMLYGVETMILNAALRLMRITHLSTQNILFNLSHRIDSLYEESAKLGIDDMYGFAPQMDLLATLHEKNRVRMFMN